MHEYALTESLVTIILESAKENNATRVTEVEVELGLFAMVVVDQMNYWFEFLSKDTILDNAEIHYRTSPGQIYCQNCGKESAIEVVDDKEKGLLSVTLDIPIFTCPHCQSTQTQILGGQDVVVKQIKVEIDD